MEQQPKNVSYAKDYVKNQMGLGTSKLAIAAEELMRESKWLPSPSRMSGVANAYKGFFLKQKIGLSLGYNIAQLVQPVYALPKLTMLQMEGHISPTSNILTSIPAGAIAGIRTMAEQLGMKVDKPFDGIPAAKYHNEAHEYAKANGINNSSMIEETRITDPRGATGLALRGVDKTISALEPWVRSSMFHMFADSLRNSPKLKTNAERFRLAEELMNSAAVDYRPGERPMAFQKMGVAGEYANILSTFTANYLNQLRQLIHETGRNPIKGGAGLATFLGIQYALGGAAGMPGFNDADALWNGMKGMMPNSLYVQFKNMDLRKMVLDNFGESALYGELSTDTGVSLGSRFAGANASEMGATPFGPFKDIAGQIADAGKLILDPTNKTKQAQVIVNSVPAGLKGAAENQLPGQAYIERPDGTYLAQNTKDLEKHKGTYVRNQTEQDVRTLGLRSQRETFSSDQFYRLNLTDQENKRRAKDLPDSIYDAIVRKDQADIEKFIKLHAQLNGSPIQLRSIITQAKQNYMRQYEQAATAAKKVDAIQGIARVTKLLKEHDERYGK